MSNDFKDVTDITVGIMGLGSIGAQVASLLKHVGFRVIGWKRKKIATELAIDHFYGNQDLSRFLKQTDILVCILPLTPETKGIVNENVLSQLPRGASLVNCARGDHVVDADLLKLLDEGHIRHAFLDVFSMEPLPPDSVMWSHPKITITPHVAGWSLAKTSVKQILENWYRHKEGKPLLNVVDVEASY